jgi:hypothetical protein
MTSTAFVIGLALVIVLGLHPTNRPRKAAVSGRVRFRARQAQCIGARNGRSRAERDFYAQQLRTAEYELSPQSETLADLLRRLVQRFEALDPLPDHRVGGGTRGVSLSKTNHQISLLSRQVLVQQTIAASRPPFARRRACRWTKLELAFAYCSMVKVRVNLVATSVEQ